MKTKAWKLWLLAGVLFLFACVMQIIDKKYFSAVINALLGSVYILWSYTSYKKNSSEDTKDSTIDVSDAGMTEVNDKIVNLIEMGKKTQAIKYCKRATRVNMRKAKDYVDLLSEENFNK